MTIVYPDLLPFQLRALRAVTDSFKQITPANGYQHDLSDQEGVERVFRGRAWFDDSDPIPMVSVLEGTDPFAEPGEPQPLNTAGVYDWRLIIQWFVRDDPAHPTDPAHLLRADIRRRLAWEKARKRENSAGMPDPFGLGSGPSHIIGMSIGAGVCRPADDVSANAYGWLGLVLRVVEDASTAHE